jgi:hypothetical protein
MFFHNPKNTLGMSRNPKPPPDPPPSSPAATCSRCHETKDAGRFAPDQLGSRGKGLCHQCEDFLWAEFLEDRMRTAAPPPAPAQPPKRSRRRASAEVPPALPPPPVEPVEPLDERRKPPETVSAPPAAEPPKRQRTGNYENVGRARTPEKVAAARENGRKGGRPAKWSKEVRRTAARWIRHQVGAGTLPPGSPLEQDLIRLARALEDGSVR